MTNELTQSESFQPIQGWIELESGEFVSFRLYNLRIELSLHVGLKFFGLNY